jgi:hypothetical protein
MEVSMRLAEQDRLWRAGESHSYFCGVGSYLDVMMSLTFLFKCYLVPSFEGHLVK